MPYVIKQGRSVAHKQALEQWRKFGIDYMNGLTPTSISKKYINPKTGKHYSRQHVHWVLNQLNKIHHEL
jgi:hypothetical protein